MLLAIDIGNTNIVCAVFDGDTICQHFRMETHGGDYSALVALGDEVTRIVIASVVPEVNEAVAQVCVEALEVSPVFVSADSVGISIAVDKPNEVGADRLVNALAVREMYKAPAIVIDFGTATTFDVVNADGAYVGGVIAPGVRLSVQALQAAAAQLPEISVTQPEVIIGSNTVHAMQSGVYFGYEGLISNIVKRITEEMGVTPFVLATGGLAPLFAEDSDVIDAVDQDLTIKGLRSIAAAMKE